jgi:hypothetical protein
MILLGLVVTGETGQGQKTNSARNVRDLPDSALRAHTSDRLTRGCFVTPVDAGDGEAHVFDAHGWARPFFYLRPPLLQFNLDQKS